MKKYLPSLVILALFEAVAITLWLTKDNLFYLFNFSYIGISIAVGFALLVSGNKYGRRIVQLLVGLYMLMYLGLICGENMQIEGFWYYLFTGVFEAATIHYAVAKIFGPLVFGRGWCGYACWTAMVLDFLPYKTPRQPRKKIGWLRYVAFAASLVFVAALFLTHVGNLERIMFWAFLVGNVLYYAVGIALAFAFQDNRAFCKYICPVTVFLKPMSYFSLLRIKCDKQYSTIILGGGIYASGIAGLSFLKKHMQELQGKRIVVFCDGASPYDENAFAQIIAHNMKDTLAGIPCFYCRGAWNMEKMNMGDRNLCKMLKKAVMKKDPNEYELWEKALMEAGDEKCDWTDKSYIVPILEAIR